MRLRAFVVLALAVLPAWAGIASARAATAQTARPVVDIVDVPGVLDRGYVAYVREQIHDARTRDTALVVLQLDAPGALRVPLRGLIDDVMRSEAPVAVWIGPRGARASNGAAALFGVAAARGMAPGSTVGPVLPVDLTASGDLAPRSNVGAGDAERLYRDLPYATRALTAQQALDQRAVDVVTPSLADFLVKLDGKTVTVNGSPRTLSLASDAVDVRFHKPGPIRRFLHAMTSASLVYILLLVGAALVVFEIFQPGFGVAGVTGGLMIASGAYGLSVLPTAWWAVAVFGLGVVLLTFDVAVHGLGIPTFAGTAMLVDGSIQMFSVGALRVPIWLVVLGTVSALVYFVPVLTTVKRNRRPIARDVTRALLGQHGEVRSVLNPEGFVWVSGSLWRARSDDGTKMRVGEPVEVVGLEGETLMVRRGT